MENSAIQNCSVIIIYLFVIIIIIIIIIIITTTSSIGGSVLYVSQWHRMEYRGCSN